MSRSLRFRLAAWHVGFFAVLLVLFCVFVYNLLARSLVRLLPSPSLHIAAGEVLLDGRDLTRASEAAMRDVRGGAIGMIFQNPTSHLDPVMRIGDQVVEGIRRHDRLGTRAARASFFAETLSPSLAMASGDGPMNSMLQSRQTSAKCAFSERKP